MTCAETQIAYLSAQTDPLHIEKLLLKQENEFRDIPAA
jgi:hypothetical protein